MTEKITGENVFSSHNHEKMQKDYFDFLRVNIHDHPLKKENYELRKAFLSALYALVKGYEVEHPVFHEYFRIYLLSFDISSEDSEHILSMEIDSDDFMTALKLSTKKHWRRKRFFILKNDCFKYTLFSDLLIIMMFCTEHLNVAQIESLGKKLKISRKDIALLTMYCREINNHSLEDAKRIYEILCRKNRHTRNLDFLLTRTFHNISIREYKKFRIAVVATMSAGKSTFMNSLVGHNLFPSRNQACTAKWTAITDNDFLNHPIGKCHLNDSGVIYSGVVTDSLLSHWNDSAEVKAIEIECDIIGIKNDSFSIVLYDTPGTNFSQDASHQEVTYDLLDKNEFDLILYLVNATNIASDDDSVLMRKIHGVITGNPKTSVLFLLNKIDEFDLEGNDNIVETVSNLKTHIESIGFENPNLLPVSAQAAKLFKLVLNGASLTKKETRDFEKYFLLFSDDLYSLPQYAALNFNVTEPSQSDALEEIIINEKTYPGGKIYRSLWNSGLPLIEKYLDKLV